VDKKEEMVLVLVPHETLYQMKALGLKHQVVSPQQHPGTPVGKKVVYFDDQITVYDDGSFSYPYCSCNSGFWWQAYDTDPNDPCISFALRERLEKLGLRSKT
jgi:hypothetical protein